MLHRGNSNHVLMVAVSSVWAEERRKGGCPLLAFPALHAQATGSPPFKFTLQCNSDIGSCSLPTKKEGRSGSRVMSEYACTHSICLVTIHIHIWYSSCLRSWREKMIREVKLICIRFNQKSEKTR